MRPSSVENCTGALGSRLALRYPPEGAGTRILPASSTSAWRKSVLRGNLEIRWQECRDVAVVSMERTTVAGWSAEEELHRKGDGLAEECRD
jgi:hypothetical protein